jgi:hypothetical protein
MTSQPAPPLLTGHVLEISFATFTPQITVHSERQLTVEIIAGEGIGFSDTVEYEAVAVRDDLSFFPGRNTSAARSSTCLISVPLARTPRSHPPKAGSCD